MSLTAASLKYIEPATLKSWVLQGKTNLGSKFLIIDVRDSDYIGGHIKNSHNIPAQEVSSEVSNILKKLRNADTNTVIFHCMLSQQRGPSSAMRFQRYLNERLELSNDDDEKKFINSLNVYILRGGFGKWQESYGSIGVSISLSIIPV